MTQYFFDVTDLRRYLKRNARLSGIQRVSVMTIAKAAQQVVDAPIWLAYSDRRSRSYKAILLPREMGVDLTHIETLCDLLGVVRGPQALPAMGKYTERPLKRQLYIWKRDLYAIFGHKSHFTRNGLSAQEWRAARRGKRAGAVARVGQPRDFGNVAKPGDQLIALDNVWFPSDLEPFLVQAHARGVEVSVLLHDLIPLVVPQYTEGDICRRFAAWLERSTGFVTHYLANSRSTGRDLQEYLESRSATQKVTVVPLAQSRLSGAVTVEAPDMLHERYEAYRYGAQMPDYLRSITKTDYVLVVGTMEVRKNIWRVATVWDRLRRQGKRDLPKLVFAGRRGWLIDDFSALMSATGNLGGWVEIVESPTDSELEYLYRNCLFTITASFYEGWGLPIGESLGYGKTAVVSNTSSMPEVGEDMVEYCDPHSLSSIETACVNLLEDLDYRKALEARIAQTELRSWDMVASDLLAAVRKPE